MTTSSNHPNRGRAANGGKPNPKPKDIIAARANSGLSQTDAAELIYSTLRTWQDWEAGKRRMHPGLFELFELKVLSVKAARKTGT